MLENRIGNVLAILKRDETDKKSTLNIFFLKSYLTAQIERREIMSQIFFYESVRRFQNSIRVILCN